MESVVLNNGVKMPMEGFGVFQMTDAKVCRKAVSMAIKAGYRLIDTASSYGNARAVGQAVRDSGLPRKDFFITSKAYIQEMGYEKTKQAFEKQLEELGTDYLDLYLIHMPFGDYYGSWRAMEELYQEGKVRAIGVSNFTSDRIIDLCSQFKIVPAVDQLEIHPFFQREEEIGILREYGIQPQAWAPFAEGMHGMFTHPVLKAIAEKHGKTPAQVILRWNVERGIPVLPKSIHEERIRENLDIWDFHLTPDDMDRISKLDLGRPLMLDTRKPSEVRRVYDYLTHPVVTSLS